MSHRSGHWCTVLSGVLLLAGCGELRNEGGTSETESEIFARVIRVDSISESWNRPESVATVGVLRLNASNFDFTHSIASGRDVSVERLDGRVLPFRLVYWDKPARMGRIEVRLDPWLQARGENFLLRWGMPDSVREDSAKVWDAIPDSQRFAIGSVLVDDFEHDSLQSRLSGASVWSATAADSATTTFFGIQEAGKGRAGRALRFSYSAPKGYVLTSVPLPAGVRSLRSLDSIVFWARGTGTVGTSFDRETSGKAWTFRKLDTSWTRIRIRPVDLDSASHLGGNIGWLAVRDEIARLTFFPSGGGTELWMDDIRLYGVNRDDLR